LTRSVLLKIIGVYITRKESLRDEFRKQECVYMLTEQLKQFNPSLIEFQVLFDLLVGHFYNEEEDPIDKMIQMTEEHEEEVPIEVSLITTPPSLRRQRTKSEFIPRIYTPDTPATSNTVNALLLEDGHPSMRSPKKRLDYFDDLIVSPDEIPKDRHSRSMTLGSIRKEKGKKKVKKEPNRALLVTPVESFKFPEVSAHTQPN
jgi:hypothetical protein